jgi:hypothetical protein
LKKQLTNDRQLWIPTQKEVAPILESFYQDKYSEEHINQLKLHYQEGCFRAYEIILANPKEDTLDVQLSNTCSPFVNDEDTRLAVEIATLRFFRNKLTIDKLQSLDIFNVIYKRLEGHNQLPRANVILSARIVDESGKAIGGKDSDKSKLINSRDRSYFWLGDNVNDDLNRLYTSLKVAELLSEDSTSDIFFKAFRGAPLDSFDRKVRWAGTKNLCVYFIYKLLNKTLIEEGNMWNQLERLFLDKKGSPMKGGRRIKNKLLSGEISPPDGAFKIDEIIKDIIKYQVRGNDI